MTATHRVIWESQRPTREEFQMALEDYIGNGGVRGKIANVHSRETGWRDGVGFQVKNLVIDIGEVRAAAAVGKVIVVLVNNLVVGTVHLGRR